MNWAILVNRFSNAAVEDKLESTQQKYETLQQKYEALEQKLNELKNIEKTMNERNIKTDNKP